MLLRNPAEWAGSVPSLWVFLFLLLCYPSHGSLPTSYCDWSILHTDCTHLWSSLQHLLLVSTWLRSTEVFAAIPGTKPHPPSQTSCVQSLHRASILQALGAGNWQQDGCPSSHTRFCSHRERTRAKGGQLKERAQEARSPPNSQKDAGRAHTHVISVFLAPVAWTRDVTDIAF